jgi:membrane protease YdiL (CAAX protease family)
VTGSEAASIANANAVVAPPRNRRTRWVALSVVEVALAAVAVAFDLAVPTLVILGLMGVSLAWRHENFRSLGLARSANRARMALQVLGLVVVWTVLQLGLFMPVITHLTGQQQDLGDFEDLEGNLTLLAVFLLLTWTIAAFGEELAYRGYVLTRTADFAGLAAAVLASSALFGLAHTEQGVVGVIVTFLDAVFFSVLRLRYRTLWAAILAHGFNNTIGLVALYFVGPVYGFW